ncbi:linker histone H1 and H5 family-domain-containing protein [Aspergillus arachidicola]|uniref:Histone H1 n=1 Tax=Aspergillus arachidicola TaxID=656916 RepID=A0A2G7G9G8_9EURO|nr:linker histone H1 and H5 family-domain-containing protein [Aspergillus arachidicola]PIG89500.1 histone H1 [Aspergillus arachidicola]
MPPKKASTGAAKKTASTHASYRDMIKDAILNLKERNGSSRQSIKKYVLANNKIAPASTNAFDSQFNKAIKAGVEKGEFTQPKGPSGPVKLAKKEAAPKPAAKKSTTAAKPKKATATTTKKAEKAEKAEKPKTTTKKTGTTTTTKKSVGRPKANTAKPRKASTAAPAVVDQPKVIGKTKSGRVTKTTAKPAEKATKKSTKKA